MPGFDKVFLIGGQVDLTEITAQGVTVTTLRTRQDRGEDQPLRRPERHAIGRQPSGAARGEKAGSLVAQID